ncbi:MAG: 2-hydroxyacid dehydrogenase [Clostridia bacterium]|nr:2-hydroxyacid dehydrogenase [Clostridia bacterium]MBO7288815.1 2-hydroxyacid dehydrogenase [Clostridia bacterium]
MKLAFYDTKPYDKIWFDKYCEEFGIKIKYYDVKLSEETAVLARDCDCVCTFVNDDVSKATIERLLFKKIKLIALRCAGYNNVDLKAAKDKITVVRVPEYSPYAVAEHGMGMILCLNRKLHRAYIRTRDFNFSLVRMTGFDLNGKTVGIIGIGKIGKVFADICSGFGMKVIAYDPFIKENKFKNIELVSFDELCQRADIISLHCPLTKDNHHLINIDAINKMKDGVFILNTSRGGLINSDSLIDGLKSGKIGGAALDVYEEESDLFFEDMSGETDRDEKMATLLSMPNVLITSHQAFLTNEALENIALVTLKNIKNFFENNEAENEVIYKENI